VLPEGHVVFAHAIRQHGALATLRGDQGLAAQEFQRALEHMRAGDAVDIDLAIVRADLAAAHFALDQRDEAREHLAASLPLLRDLLLPTEVSRIDAESLAVQLGLL